MQSQNSTENLVLNICYENKAKSQSPQQWYSRAIKPLAHSEREAMCVYVCVRVFVRAQWNQVTVSKALLTERLIF